MRTEKFRYIRNFLTDRILLQPQYRDAKPSTKRLRELHTTGKLEKIPEWAFFGKRPAEELYDIEKDPHQVNNLATDPQFTDELKRHRELLNGWIKTTGDQGEQPESKRSLRAIYKRWGKKCVNPEFDIFKKEVKGEAEKLTVADYKAQKIRGWTVHVENSLKDHPLREKALTMLDGKFGQIEKEIAPSIVTELKKVPFWLNKDVRTGACYHPNPAWLKNNQRMPEKVQSIELQNIHHFVHWSKSQPMMVLHELAHAYHHRVLNFKDPVITAAFKNIVASKKYEKVKHVSGKTQRHYALNNEKEYFAECTEAYFGKNDFFPFTRDELKSYDPQGYAMVESVWKISAN